MNRGHIHYLHDKKKSHWKIFHITFPLVLCFQNDFFILYFFPFIFYLSENVYSF